ncbi:hypothetical protein CPIN17260_1000 [Campylobacter pinnipediorum subsp. pinnipediorum]|uniref:hypothetical protein n=1 Tax=Campylobacter pinnipediorum TaxID=1965231 RepID=UPI00099497E7|nr:hypothetical protein [Campylobacter pinnipediorum]AQW81294.1 hypothetical protein CPIN17260_1000 [Campylobacter pinnipediorum subsp. pinnipediorum]
MLIVIDKYIFEVKHNISNLTKSTTINIDKQNTITKPVYSHLGGVEDDISFDATILLDDIKDFTGFEELVKKGEPLSFSSFDLADNKQILINKLTQSVSNFVKSSFNGVTYYTKNIKISGYVIE